MTCDLLHHLQNTQELQPPGWCHNIKTTVHGGCSSFYYEASISKTFFLCVEPEDWDQPYCMGSKESIECTPPPPQPLPPPPVHPSLPLPPSPPPRTAQRVKGIGGGGGPGSRTPASTRTSAFSRTPAQSTEESPAPSRMPPLLTEKSKRPVALAFGALGGIAVFLWMMRSSNRQGTGYESVGRESYAEEGGFLKGAPAHSCGTPDTMVSVNSTTHLCCGDAYSTAGPRAGEVGPLLRADPTFMDASPKR